MPRNGSGTFTPAATMATANTVSNAATVNSVINDIATGLTDSINKDGTKSFAANQSMGGFKLTSVGNGTATGDAANAGQVQGGLLNWADAGGTADAITGSYTPAVTSVSDGNLFFVRASAANATTTPTFTPNSGTVTARTIVKHGNQALAAGDIGGDGHELILRYRSSDTKYELLNPKATAATPYTVNAQTEETSVAVGDMLGGYDTSGTAERKFSVQNVMKAINGLTEDTSPDTSADFILTYDTSASDVKKVKPSNLLGGTWAVVETLNPSSVATVATTVSLTGYKAIRFTMFGLTPATNNVQPKLEVSADGTSYSAYNADSGAYGASFNTSDTGGFLCPAQVSNTASNGGISGSGVIYNTNVGERANTYGNYSFKPTGAATNGGQYAGASNTITISHIRFSFSSGNIASGVILIEGLA